MVHSQKLNDEKLFRAFQAGGPAAFKRFLQLNFLSWVNYAKDLLQNKLHSEEVTLEAFSKVWDHKESFTSFKNVDVFVRLAIDRVCRDFLNTIVEEEKRPVIRIPGIKKNSKYHRYNSRKNRKWLKANEQYVSSLSNQERHVFILHYFVDVGSLKISYLLGTHEVDVHSSLRRANLKLRTLRMKNKWQRIRKSCC